MNRSLDMSYRYQMQYHFNPLSGWDGEKFSYEFVPRSTEDRTLLINPFNDFGFLEVKVFPGDLDPGIIDFTEVHLHYEDPGIWSRDKVISVRPDSGEQLWRLRLSHTEQRTYIYRYVHHLKDGSKRETLPETTQATTIAVNDPFEDPLVIEFFPNYNASNIRMLLVDVEYNDPGNQYERKETLRIEGPNINSQRLRIARINPDLKQYTFQIMILGADNSVRRVPPVKTEATIVFIGEHIHP
jgi:hypothetical protein